MWRAWVRASPVGYLTIAVLPVPLPPINNTGFSSNKVISVILHKIISKRHVLHRRYTVAILRLLAQDILTDV